MTPHTPIEALAIQIVSAQCSYETQEQKQELVNAFISGAISQRNEDKRYVAVVEPCEGGSDYIRGWRAALGEVFKELKKRELIVVCPPEVMEYLLDLLNAMSHDVHREIGSDKACD